MILAREQGIVLNKTTNQKRLTKKKKTYQVDEVDPFY
jgi:hypothetical protein